MQRKLLAATVAAGPLLALALSAAPGAALAQTSISTATTAPVATATVKAGGPDDITVASTGSIILTAPGPLVTLNSNNNVNIAGSLSTSGVSNSTGVLAIGGNTGNITVGAPITLNSTFSPTDSDNDGDLDGAFADGANRYGVRVTGPAALNGTIGVVAGGTINVTGADSAGISVETGLNGSLLMGGAISATGDRVFGVRAAGPVTGNVRIDGSTTASGLGATGVALDGNIGGALVVQGGITATGFRYTTRPIVDTQRALLDADDKLIGGSALRIGGSVAGGVLFDVAPTVSATVTDTDGDGVADSAEGNAVISAYGSAPTVVIGSATTATTLGLVNGSAYGLINRGTLIADGVYDGVTSTAVQIGGGAAVGIAGGIQNTGIVNSTAYFANATGLSLGSGVSAPAFANSGSMATTVTTNLANTARGVSIQPGAAVSSFTNTGSLTTTVGGSLGSAIAFEDLGGGVRTVTNTGLIAAAVTGVSGVTTTGKATALDLRAATGGVAVTQNGAPSATITTDTDKDGVNDSEEPAIVGDVLFGAGDDRLILNNGRLAGAMAFGAGADVLSISGGATATGALTDTDGRLAISIGAGSLTLTNAATINATSLTVGTGGGLRFTADPANNTATRIVVGSASLANGAQVDMTLASILDAPTRYTVIQAGTLNVGTLTSSLTGAPYLYVSSASANAALGQVYVDVRPRTASELGFIRAEAQAYPAVIQALKKDSALAAPLLAQTTREGVTRLYDQLLPEQGQGLFDALAYSNAQISEGISQKPDLYERYGPDSVWVQEINTLVRTENGQTLGSDTQAFGFAVGYEALGENGGALGVALSYMNLQERDNAAQVGEQTTASIVQGSAYWRRSLGGLRIAVGGGGGYGWMNADRRFFSGDLNADGVNDLARENSADWNGLIGQAFGSVAYEYGIGRYYVRPEGRVDYLYVNEGRRQETGGGAGFDLNVAKRTSSSLEGLAAMTFGATYGHDLWLRPEVRVGYRQRLAGSLGDTVANFAGGTPFTLTPDSSKDGAVTLDLALRAGTPMSYVAIQGGVAAAKRSKRYNVRLAGRMMF